MKALKGILMGALSLICVVTASVGFVGCKDEKSAYEIWLSHGHSGTETDFLEWLEANAGTQEGMVGFAYYPLSDGTYAVSQGNTIYLEKIVVPSTYKGKAVTMLADSAFFGSNAKSIIIPDSVTEIGEYAFASCSSLTEITLPFVGASKDGTSNTHFGYFFGASGYADNTSYVPSSLKKVRITSATSIDDYAFYNCSGLTSVVIGDSVTSIGESAFYNCSGLTSMVIPDSVTSIGNKAFLSCYSLTSIEIPDSVTSIGEFAFSRCPSLTSVYYKGNASDADKISIGWSNNYLTKAKWYYYRESQPTVSGNYWHYDKNGEVVVW